MSKNKDKKKSNKIIPVLATAMVAICGPWIYEKRESIKEFISKRKESKKKSK